MQQILSAVRIRPFLYDTNNALYGDVEWQSTAWREISEQLGIPDAKVRWFRLRDALKNAANAPEASFWQEGGIEWLRPYFTASSGMVSDIYIPPSDPTPAKRPRVDHPPTTPTNGAQAVKKWEVCDETMKRIFATVKNYPALYDPKNADFGNEEQHAELWRVIALELDLPGESSGASTRVCE
ncbi:hypothetical protein AAVH_37059 [Aphelenchoides avenae]|nr:hypothetical protein AAVH_37059 [Aphelenchus avenae]